MCRNLKYSMMETGTVEGERFPTGAAVVTALVSIAYLFFIHVAIGLRIEHVLLVSIYNIGFVAHPWSRRLMGALAIFLVFGILYDVMKAWPNYLVNEVDIEGLYRTEKQLFGIGTGGELLTPNEFFDQNNNVALDITAGLFYLNWMSVPLIFAVYLYFRNRRIYLYYGLVFLLANILGFIIYYMHPAAPPWYVEQYGFVFQQGMKASAAGLVRFDRIFGLEVFQWIYTRNSNVFAALPSLHAAYPTVVLFYALKVTRTWYMKAFYVVYMLGIWFAAVYSGHHYLIDVLLGIACAVAGIILFHSVILRIPFISRLLRKYEQFIT